MKMYASFLIPLLVALILQTGAALADEIHTAAGEGDLARVTALITSDPTLATLPDERLCQPIHFATNGNHVEIMKLLHKTGAGLDVVDVDGDTPLHWGAYVGHLEAIEWLLDKNVDINTQNKSENTAVLYAVKQRRYEAVELLATRGADLEIANDYGRTPLLWNVREGGDLEMARLLLRLGADINARDRFGATPLSLAAWRNFRTLVNVLLDNGAEVETGGDLGNELLTEAIGNGLTRLYQKLVDGGMEIPTDVNERGSYLHMAASGGSSEIVADLVTRGCPVDAADSFGWTPLHYAAARSRTGATAELLRHVGNADSRTKSGYSALNLAEEKGGDEAATLLRQKGVDTEPRRFPELTGACLGQPEPENEPCLFAPDIVANPYGQHGNVTFSDDGKYAMWSGYVDMPDSGYSYGTILFSEQKNNRWTPPRIAPFAAERQGDDVPFFAPDGQQLFFLSRRPLAPDQEGGKENIWKIARVGDGWGQPEPLPPVVNRFDHHWQISVARNGNLYFASRDMSADTRGIYVSSYVDGQYTEPVFLGFGGSTPCISPDEDYLITLDFNDEGRFNVIRYRQEDGAWGEAINLTAATDRGISGLCPTVSPDGRWFFFIGYRSGVNNTWYVNAGFIEELRHQQGAGH